MKVYEGKVMIDFKNKNVRIYFGILVFMVVLFAVLAVFSDKTQSNCSICGEKGIIGDGLHWDVLIRKWYYFQQKREDDMNVSVLLCDKCRVKQRTRHEDGQNK